MCWVLSLKALISHILIFHCVCFCINLSTKTWQFKRPHIADVSDYMVFPSSFNYELYPSKSLPTNEDGLYSAVQATELQTDLNLINSLMKGTVSNDELNEQLKEIQENGFVPPKPQPAEPENLDENAKSYNDDVKETANIFSDINTMEHSNDAKRDALFTQFKLPCPGRKIDPVGMEPFEGGLRRSQRKRLKTRRFSNSDFRFTSDSALHANDIVIEQEITAWNSYYNDERLSDSPFSGIGLDDTLRMILASLKRVRPHRIDNLIDEDDVILEVGHGKHPLIWKLMLKFKKFKYYFGIEFSTTAIHEAIKLKLRNGSSHNDLKFGENIEFLGARSINYFNEDNTANVDVIIPEGSKVSELRAGMVSIALAKSFLDYITCRLSQSINALSWDEEPRISKSVVDMFDCLSVALREPSGENVKNLPVVILVEPDDFVKFRDHICTIAKVIYTSSFVTESPARFLRLVHIKREKNTGAICYTFQKFNRTYNNYSELRNSICSITKKLYQLQAYQDNDWLLPYDVPPKWKSHESKDFDNVSSI